MRIFLVGANGTIGSAIARELGARHEIVSAGRTSGDIRLDITDPDSIRAAFEAIGSCDAVVSATGKAKYAPLADMTGDAYVESFLNKAMGQINLVLIGREFVSPGGSFTLTTGLLTHDPIVSGTAASTVNGAVEAFVRAAAIEMPRGQRINVVSPGVIQEAMHKLAPLFRGHEPVPAARAALAYSKSVEGARTGQVFTVL